MKFFQVTAIINSQARRIETNSKEDIARFTQSILNQNQKNEKNTLTIPEAPIDNLNLSSDYIKMNKKNSREEIVKYTSEESLNKLQLLQNAIYNKYGKGISIFIPIIKKSEKLSENTIYGRDEKSNKHLLNRGNILNRSLRTQIFKEKPETVKIDIDDKYLFYLDNDGDFDKDIIEIIQEKFLLIKYDFMDIEMFDVKMNIYDGLRIWDTDKSNNKPEIFAIGFKNYGVIFCDEILLNMQSTLKYDDVNGKSEKTHIDIKL